MGSTAARRANRQLMTALAGAALALAGCTSTIDGAAQPNPTALGTPTGTGPHGPGAETSGAGAAGAGTAGSSTAPNSEPESAAGSSSPATGESRASSGAGSGPDTSGAAGAASGAADSESAASTTARTAGAAVDPGTSPVFAAVAPKVPAAQPTQGCGTPRSPQQLSAPVAAARAVTIGINDTPRSLNGSVGSTYSIPTLQLQHLITPLGAFYDDRRQLIDNTGFVSCTVTRQNPYTVRYTVADAATWSDGTAVTAADLLLDWAARTNALDSGTLQYDDNGTIKSQNTPVFDSDGMTTGYASKVPTLSKDSKSLTVEYAKPHANIAESFSRPSVPAHVVAKRAFGEKSAAKATAALVSTVQALGKNPKDAAALGRLAKVANVWNAAFTITPGKLPPADLRVTAGPYQLTKMDAKQLELTANPKYTWGPRPSVRKVLLRIVQSGNGPATAQAVSNGELSFGQTVLGQDSDVAAMLGGVKARAYPADSFRQLYLVQDQGPFAAKTYGGGAAGAKKAALVRRAFLAAVPRERLAAMQAPAKGAGIEGDLGNGLIDSYVMSPLAPGYPAVARGNGSGSWPSKGDPARAKQLLAQAGVKAPAVRLMFLPGDRRREQQLRLIAENAIAAGFTVRLLPEQNFYSKAVDRAGYDAGVSGWSFAGGTASSAVPMFRSGGAFNWGNYSSPAADALLDKLMVAASAAQEQSLATQIDKQLAADAVGLPLTQGADLVLVNPRQIRNVSDNGLAQGAVWNYWQWAVPR